MMAAIDRLRSSATLKYYSGIKLSCFYFVCLKKVYGQKRDLFNFIDSCGCYSKGIYIGLVNPVGLILKMKDLQSKLPEVFFCYRKYFISPFTNHYRLVSG